MRTLEYIDPIISPDMVLESPNHHTRFEKTVNPTRQKNALLHNYSEFSGKHPAVKYAHGAKIMDAQGKEYIDFQLSQGANILGHTPNRILDAIEEVLLEDKNFTMPTLTENLLAKLIQEAFPSVEKVTFVNSGAGAVKGAIRLSEAFTRKRKTIIFEGSTLANGLGELSNQLITLPFNDELAVSEAFRRHKDEISAIFVEPVLSTHGVILPKPGYLQFLRSVASENHALLIFDETTTGFRPGPGGAQAHFNVRPDMTILGKIIGGGYPIGAIGGRGELISQFKPHNQDNNISSISLTAGLAMVRLLSAPLFYETLNLRSADFIHCLSEITKHKGMVINSFQSMFSLYVSEKEITNYQEIKRSDVHRFEKFTRTLLEEGISLAPTPFAANFVSIAHMPEDLNRTLEMVYKVLKTV